MNQLQPPATDCQARHWLGAAVGTGYDRVIHYVLASSRASDVLYNIRPGGQHVNYDQLWAKFD